MKSIFISISILSFLCYCLINNSGCANIVPPQGGPRDSLPPVLVHASPEDSSKNFKSKTITFTFDEYLDQLQNIQENLLITPTPETNPLVEAKLKTLTVRFRDSLETNTTYLIKFGNAIRDINEGNVLRNFSYMFSTGNYFDTLELTGRVLLAETGKIDTTLIVMLHRNGGDSALVNEKPRYVTKLDRNGNFHFRLLPPGTFYIYALKDEGSTRKYFNKTQLFAFADQPVEIKPGADSIILYAFNEKKEPQIPTGIGLSRPAGTRGDDRRLKFLNNLVNGQQELTRDHIITFEQPLRTLDTAKISISTDSAFIPLTGYRLMADSNMKTLTLQNPWKENTRYNLILDQDFAEDTLGRKLLKTDTLYFTTKRKAEYGSLRIRLRNLDLSRNPVLLFLQGEQVKNSFPLSSEILEQTMFTPGDYELRILYDDNKNGKWDPGDFFGNRKQPELVQPIQRSISVKPSWENEFEIIIPPNFP